MALNSSLISLLFPEDVGSDEGAHNVLRALSGFDQVRRLLTDLVEEANEGLDEDEAVDCRAIDTAISIQTIVADMAETLAGLAAQNSGLQRMNLDLAAQRNEAAQQAQNTMDDLIAGVAATLGCDEQQAWAALVACPIRMRS